METVTETIQPETQVEPQTQQAPIPDTTAKPQEQAFDPAKIDPKAKEYFEKEYSSKYSDYESHKKKAQEYELVRNDPEFQKWIISRNQPEAPKPFDITDEQFSIAMTDRAQFVKLVQEAAKHLVNTEIGPKLQQTDRHFQVESKKAELSKVMQKYQDFGELDKRGLIAPIVEKYGGAISFDDAYWIAKRETWNEDVAKAARGQLNSRKAASVEKGDNAPSVRKNVLKFSSREEAMRAVAQAVREGREVPEIDY